MPRSLDARGMIGGQVRRSTKESKKALQTTKSTPKGIQCLRMDGSSPVVKFFGNAPVAVRLLLFCRFYGNSFAPRFDGHAGADGETGGSRFSSRRTDGGESPPALASVAKPTVIREEGIGPSGAEISGKFKVHIEPYFPKAYTYKVQCVP